MLTTDLPDSTVHRRRRYRRTTTSKQASNYNIGLQRLKLVYTAYCGLHNLAENWSWVPDVNGRDRDETETRPRRDRDETETRPRRLPPETETLTIFLGTRPRCWNVSRPRRQDRNHNPWLRPPPSTHNRSFRADEFFKAIRFTNISDNQTHSNQEKYAWNTKETNTKTN